MALVIGIAGGTGSGKTTIAHHLEQALPSDQVSRLEHDAYYVDRPDLDAEARAAVNYDHPESLETTLLIKHIQELKAGTPIEAPLYDFARHRRSEQTRPIVSTPVIIVEGILVLAVPKLRDELDIKIFVDTDSDIRVFRRIRRDMEQRGRTFASIREQYYATVRPMHLQFVEPSRRTADLIVPEGGDNEVALDLIVSKLRSVLTQSNQSD